MTGADEKLIPAGEARAEILVVNSRFIASAAPAFSVEAARAFITRIKAEFGDATHNVPAFVIGHGASTITHSSDDGELSGTAGRPALAVLQGSGYGDIAVVVTRYFGGTKLGTGGLVRAYGDAVRAVLDKVKPAVKVATQTLYMEMEYSWYERVARLVEAQGGEVLEQDFGVAVALTARFRQAEVAAFQDRLRELTHAQVEAEVLETNPETIFRIRDR